MRFVLSFKTGSVEFEIPEAHLKRHPETMLSVMTRPRWAGPEGTPEVQRLEAPETAETYWSDGMAKAVVTLYARAALWASLSRGALARARGRGVYCAAC